MSAYLTGIPWSEGFMRQYAAALGREQDQQIDVIKRILPGSFSALCVSYYNSPEFCGLEESTQGVRRNILERFRRDHGHRHVDDLKAAHIHKILGGMSKRPESANGLLKALRAVLTHAVAIGLAATNAARGVKPYRSRNPEGFHTWTEAEIKQFQTTHPFNTRAGLAMALALYTGQRRGDVIRLGWQHVRDGRIVVRQQKTKVVLAIPVHPELELALTVTSMKSGMRWSFGRRACEASLSRRKGLKSWRCGRLPGRALDDARAAREGAAQTGRGGQGIAQENKQGSRSPGGTAQNSRVEKTD
jgi:integrase